MIKHLQVLIVLALMCGVEGQNLAYSKLSLACDPSQPNYYPNCGGCTKTSESGVIKNQCLFCKKGYGPDPQNSLGRSDWCSSLYEKEFFVSPDFQVCRQNTEISSSCAKDSPLNQRVFCKCPLNCSALVGTFEQPFDSLLDVFWTIERQALNYSTLNITINFLKGANGNSKHYVIPNELYYTKTGPCLMGTYMKEGEIFNFFARKKAQIRLESYVCTTSEKCFSDQEKAILIFKQLNFHLFSTESFIIRGLIFEGSQVKQDFVASLCNFRRDMDCCLEASDKSLKLNRQAYDFIEDADRQQLNSLKINICEPRVFFLNNATRIFENDNSKLRGTYDFSLNQPSKYQFYGLFNLEFDYRDSSSLSQPSALVTDVEVRNFNFLFSLQKVDRNNKVIDYGYNSVRSFLFFHLNAQITVQNSLFERNYFVDGYLTNINNIDPQFANLLKVNNPYVFTDCLESENIPCSKISIIHSTFTEFNPYKWSIYSSRDAYLNFTTNQLQSLNAYSMSLSGIQGSVAITGSVFQKAIPIFNTDQLFCRKLDNMVGWVEADSVKKPSFPGYMHYMDEYSKLSSSHFYFVYFAGELNIINNQFLNNTGGNGVAIYIKDQSMTSKILNKGQISFSKNVFKQNMGLYSGSAVKIFRWSLEYLSNFCGPILFDSNLFEENLGCNYNVGLVDVICAFGEVIDYGYQKNADISIAWLDDLEASKAFASQEFANSAFQKRFAEQLEPQTIKFVNNIVQRNYISWSNGILVLGGLDVQVMDNLFNSNGVLHSDLYFLLQSSYYFEFFSELVSFATLTKGISQGLVVDASVNTKETSTIFLDLCDRVTIINNTFVNNWNILTGDPYYGSSILLFRSLGFHGVRIQNNNFEGHKGLPVDIGHKNLASNLNLNKASSAIIGLNVLSYQTYMRLNNISILVNNNTFKDNIFYINQKYKEALAGNTKIDSYLTFYSNTAQVSLVEYFYPFDVLGNGPNSADVQTQVSDFLNITISDSFFFKNQNLNGNCMIYVPSGNLLSVKNLSFVQNSNLARFSSSPTRNLQGYLCNIDTYGILAEKNQLISYENLIFTNNSGLVLTHITDVSYFELKNIFVGSSNAAESLFFLKSQNIGVSVSNLTAQGNRYMIQGALLVLESSNMTFKGLTIKQNFPNQVASLTVLNSKNIRIFNSSFEDNYDDLKAITPFQVPKQNPSALSTNIMINASILINFTGCSFKNNILTHGAALFLTSFSQVYISFSIITNNTAFSGGAFLLQKNSQLFSNSNLLRSNKALLNGGVACLFEQSQFQDQNHSTVIMNQADKGGFVYSSTSNVLLENSNISFNYAYRMASTVYMEIGYLEVLDSVFQENDCSGSGLIFVSESTLLSNRTQYNLNSAQVKTYGIQSERSILQIDNSIFNGTSINISDVYSINGGFINIVEGQANINRSQFLNGLGYFGGAMYTGFESIVRVDSSIFQGQKSYSQGGSVFTFLSKNVTFFKCLFSENRAIMEGADVYGLTTTLVRLKNSIFEHFQGYSCSFKNMKKTQVVSTTFQGSSTYTTEQALKFDLCDSTEVDGSLFRGLQSQLGAAIFIKNQYPNIYSYIHITNTNFSKNQALQGGAIYLNGNITGVIQNTTFYQNKALQPQDIQLERVSGLGGAVLYECARSNQDCILKFMSCNFSENYASVAGGAIKWNDRTIWVDEMTNFTSNWAVYGPDIGSYAICLIKVYEKKDYYENSICYNNQVGRGREIVTRFEMQNVASGQLPNTFDNSIKSNQTSPALQMALIDHYDFRVKSDNYSKSIVLPIVKLTSDDTGWDQIRVLNNEQFADQGFFNFSKLQIISVPGNILEMSIQTNGIPFRLNRQSYRRFLEDFSQFEEDVVDEYLSEDQNLRLLESISLSFEVFERDRLKNDSCTFRMLQQDSSNIVRSNSDVTLKVDVRSCIRGEILQLDYTCLQCPIYKYSLANEKDIKRGSQCKECKRDQAMCFGLYYMGPLPGFWRLSSYHETFHPCPTPFACLGYEDPNFQSEENFKGICVQGHRGNLCIDCIEGYALFNGIQCIPCSNNILYWLRVIVVVVLAFHQTISAIKSTLETNKKPLKRAAILMKMLMNFVQTIFIFTAFNIKMPEAMMSMFSNTNQVAAAPMSAFNFDCVYKSSIFVENGIRPYFAQSLILAIIPLILFIIIITFWICKYLLKYGMDITHDPYLQSEMHIDITASIIIVMFTILPKIIELNLKAFKCINLGDPETPEMYLQADPEIQCWQSAHWKFILFIAVPSMMIWTIICPLQILHFFREKREILFSKEFLEAYGFLLRGYNRNSFGNEFFIFFRKYILIVISIYADFNGQIQCLLALALTTVFLTYHTMQAPYDNKVFNDLEKYSLIGQVVILYCLMYISSVDTEGLQLLFIVIIAIAYLTFLLQAIYYYSQEMLNDTLSNLYGNRNLYNLIVKVKEKVKNKIVDQVEKLYRQHLLPIDFDHQSKYYEIFMYLQEKTEFDHEEFGKEDEFVQLKKKQKKRRTKMMQKEKEKQNTILKKKKQQIEELIEQEYQDMEAEKQENQNLLPKPEENQPEENKYLIKADIDPFSSQKSLFSKQKLQSSQEKELSEKQFIEQKKQIFDESSEIPAITKSIKVIAQLKKTKTIRGQLQRGFQQELVQQDPSQIINSKEEKELQNLEKVQNPKEKSANSSQNKAKNSGQKQQKLDLQQQKQKPLDPSPEGEIGATASFIPKEQQNKKDQRQEQENIGTKGKILETAEKVQKSVEPCLKNQEDQTILQHSKDSSKPQSQNKKKETQNQDSKQNKKPQDQIQIRVPEEK